MRIRASIALFPPACLAFVLLASIPALAQTGSVLEPAAPTASVVPARTVEFFDGNRKKLPSELGATERRETIYRDSVSAAVRKYYLPSGQLKSYTPYAHVRRQVRHGTASEYDASGKLRYQATFLAGKRHGELLTYYPSGTLKRRDQFEHGQRTAGECFGSDGQPVAYHEYEAMPVYSEGAGDQAAVQHAVMTNTRYPAEALRRGVYGVVKVKFVVDKTGRVANVEPQQPAPGAVPPGLASAYQALQEAAAESVRQLKPFRPGTQDGEPVAVSFTVPVTFKITQPTTR